MGCAMYLHSPAFYTVELVQGMLSWGKGGQVHCWGRCTCVYVYMYVDARGQSRVCGSSEAAHVVC